MRHDFRLSIITVFGACAVLAISPFAVLRFVQGNMLASAVDFGIVLAIVIANVYAWRGGSLEWAGTCVTITNTLGCLAIFWVVGSVGLYWLYPTLLANAFVVRPRTAAFAGLAATAAVQFRPDAFTGTAEQFTVAVTMLLLSLFSYIFAKRTHLQKQTLEELATQDPLTGARNRRAMEDELAIAINAFRRNGRPIALVMLDLDHFKHVNDRFGHEEGDRVLREFVRLLKASTRATDRLFRFGGEEFVLLMEHTDELRANHSLTQMLDRLRGLLRTTDGVVTVSAGAAVLGHGEDRNHWLARADAALYQAKQQGRDRAVVAAAAPSGPQGRA
jgi:diguanylate cyclase (GGDEF)-like protein